MSSAYCTNYISIDNNQSSRNFLIIVDVIICKKTWFNFSFRLVLSRDNILRSFEKYEKANIRHDSLIQMTFLRHSVRSSAFSFINPAILLICVSQRVSCLDWIKTGYYTVSEQIRIDTFKCIYAEMFKTSVLWQTVSR